MLNPFIWLRRKAAEAVTLGVADGLRAVSPDEEPPADLTDLRALLAQATEPKALPAAGETDTTNKGRKGNRG
jgi:hypothetical protein